MAEGVQVWFRVAGRHDREEPWTGGVLTELELVAVPPVDDTSPDPFAGVEPTLVRVPSVLVPDVAVGSIVTLSLVLSPGLHLVS